MTVADIGIDVGPVAAGITEQSDVAAWLPACKPSTHKWEVGGVMVVGGTTGMTGAPMFVSHAAMRAGAGIVWCGMPGEEAAAAGSGTEVITVAPAGGARRLPRRARGRRGAARPRALRRGRRSGPGWAATTARRPR